MFDIDGRALSLIFSTISRRVQRLTQFYKDIKLTYLRHGGGEPVWVSKEANPIAKHVWFSNADHGIRALVYACPEEEHEEHLPPFLRTYIFTDPPEFYIAGEGTSGKLKEENWKAAMKKADLPDAFIEKIEPEVRARIKNYGR